jgi:hypothetical protein
MQPGTTYPPRTILDENGQEAGFILSPGDYRAWLKLLSRHADWESLPQYLQDRIDNLLADEAEQEGGELTPLSAFLAGDTE